MKRFKKILKIAGIALLVVITVPLVIGQVLKLFSHVEPPPGDLVDVGGYKLHINCTGPKDPGGEELPTVIIESGAGTVSPVYHWIQNGVAEKTKVCVYDRAGLGWSEESDLPRDAKTINTALHTLLDKEGIKRPFVFVGHSIAGLYMRDYVERYPDDVAGLVFLDPSHPDQLQKAGMTKAKVDEMVASAKTQVSIVKWLIALGATEVYNPIVQMSPDWAATPEDVQRQLDYLSKKPSMLDTAFAELDGFDAAGKQAAMNKSLGDRPVVVFSATMPLPDGMLPEGVSKEEFQSEFVKLHDEIAALSTRGEHIKIDTADHMGLVTNKENAAKVVPYIIKVLKESMKKPDPAGGGPAEKVEK
jgi:pimeloyl-ACP methyl ester carboxylesterase